MRLSLVGLWTRSNESHIHFLMRRIIITETGDFAGSESADLGVYIFKTLADNDLCVPNDNTNNALKNTQLKHHKYIIRTKWCRASNFIAQNNYLIYVLLKIKVLRLLMMYVLVVLFDVNNEEWERESSCRKCSSRKQSVYLILRWT